MRMAKNPKLLPKPKRKSTKKVESIIELAMSTDTNPPIHDRKKAIELFNEGKEFYNTGDIDKAEELYNQSIDADPSFSNPYNNLGVIYYTDKKDVNKALDYYLKAFFNDRLDKLVADNLTNIYNEIGDEESAKEVQIDYDKAVQDSINTNTENHKITRTVITRLATDMKKLEQNTDIETLADNLLVSNKALEDIQQDKIAIKAILADASVSVMLLKNHELAGYFDLKAQDLEDEKEIFEKKFITMIGISILFLAISIGLNMWKANWTLTIDSIAQGMVITTPIMVLLLWLTKYYNRRLHETIHLIEEYKHKSIVLYSFKAYSERLETLGGDDKTPLLDYTQKVSTTINQSPTHALTRKKTDKIPTGEIVELLNAMHPLRYNNNNNNTNGKIR